MTDKDFNRISYLFKGLENLKVQKRKAMQDVEHNVYFPAEVKQAICDIVNNAYNKRIEEAQAKIERITIISFDEKNGGESMNIFKEIYAVKTENAELKAQVEELTDKHWEECRQIAHYDDELKCALKLLTEALGKVSTEWDEAAQALILAQRVNK